ncbi:MAG TPA: metalloregulator ArsR/SmtB family transcription factor [Candidatus Limnocylindrales bacterium]
MNDEDRLLSAIADPTRLAILRQLAAGECCACDIAACYDLRQPTVSHHLKVLRDAGWLEAERRGTWIWYSLRPQAAERLRAIADGLVGARPGAGGPSMPSGRRQLPVVQPMA